MNLITDDLPKHNVADTLAALNLGPDQHQVSAHGSEARLASLSQK